VTYTTIPPHVPETFENSNGMRFWKSRVLNELGGKYKIENWTGASELFNQSGKLIIDICKAAMDRDRKAISDLILKVADIEERAYGFVKTK